ncbi:hypothetical protein CHS0354_016286 [Potamilus streckersoni]|uniref:Symplekin n=1 Tax=Potamilus streckersoni TaxID=2493646 RepID=A0AAE0RXJ1_9BIVA|nr:hypothetical protein CHS0354_016286 [Potamilus streckersoni]
MASDSRLSTAAQFYMEEEDKTANEPSSSTSTYDKVVDLINQASLLQKDTQKINNLKQVQELIVNKESNLLDNFLDEMIAFQTDRSVDVRKFVVGFMEDACKKDPEILPKVLPCLHHLLQDENINVQKKVILTLSGIFRSVLVLLSTTKFPTPEMSQVWDLMSQMKLKVYEMLDSDNDGIRTHAVKFIEGVVLTLSWKTLESEIPKTTKPESDICLDIVPESSKYLKVKKLEDEGKKMFAALLQFQASPHISSINLMTVMGSITNIAKQRPAFFGRVVQAFEGLHVNLPPTLAKSQVSSVRKNLKMQMLALLKHQCSFDYLSNITTLLTDLGATQSEVMKAMPKLDDSKKRKAEETVQTSKKQKVEKVELDDDDDVGMTPWVSQSEKKLASAQLRQTAIDITSEDLIPRLTSQNVSDLVLISMVMLPEAMPAHFQATYTPIAAAGTEGQIKHMARLLATQLTMAGMGKGIAEIQRQAAEEADENVDATPASEAGTSPKQLIQTLVGGTTLSMDAARLLKVDPFKPPIMPVRRGVKQFKLSAVTQPLSNDTMDLLTRQALQRILKAERAAVVGNALPARTKLIASLVSLCGGELKHLLQDFIFEDLKGRADLAFSWLYQEYANCQGFSAATVEKTTMASYDECLTRLLNGLLEITDQKESLFHRLILEAPSVTENAMQILKKYCSDEERVTLGLNTLKTLILTRPSHRLRFLDALLEFTSHERAEMRSAAIKVIKELYEHEEAHNAIQHYALQMLKNLTALKPSAEFYTKLRGKHAEVPQTWTEEGIKMCLYLYLGLLPTHHKMIHELAAVYTATAADIKRTILRMLETPVKGMGMQSPELLTFVENCPKGAETLVTRVIHILTDKTAPSPELVERVRDLYHKRVPDVRFLIPVLTGLSKKEVIAALPKLIKLNPIVVKEVFNRLLGGHGDASYTSPLTPAELLIALHNIDPNKCDMKTIIKATNLCFSEKTLYTQEALALVMQSLMEQSPLPTLFMRTVLQSLNMYPRLLGLVMNILQRLISKQVWKQKKVWEGFVKCCEKTRPQSFQVLLQLPAPQLKNVFELGPDQRGPLLQHVNSFTPQQKMHIPATIINVLETDPMVAKHEAELQAQKEKEERDRLAAEEIIREHKAEEERRRLQESEEQLKENVPVTEKIQDSQEVRQTRKDEEEAGRRKAGEELDKYKSEEVLVKRRGIEEQRRRIEEEAAKKKREAAKLDFKVKEEPQDEFSKVTRTVVSKASGQGRGSDVIQLTSGPDDDDEPQEMTIDLSIVKTEPMEYEESAEADADKQQEKARSQAESVTVKTEPDGDSRSRRSGSKSSRSSQSSSRRSTRSKR